MIIWTPPHHRTRHSAISRGWPEAVIGQVKASTLATACRVLLLDEIVLMPADAFAGARTIRSVGVVATAMAHLLEVLRLDATGRAERAVMVIAVAVLNVHALARAVLLPQHQLHGVAMHLALGVLALEELDADW